MLQKDTLTRNVFLQHIYSGSSNLVFNGPFQEVLARKILPFKLRKLQSRIIIIVLSQGTNQTVTVILRLCRGITSLVPLHLP